MISDLEIKLVNAFRSSLVFWFGLLRMLPTLMLASLDCQFATAQSPSRNAPSGSLCQERNK